jgi:hypothetical protein
LYIDEEDGHSVDVTVAMADSNEDITEDKSRIVPLKVQTATAALIDVMDKLWDYPQERVRFCSELISRVPADLMHISQVIVKPVWVSKILCDGIPTRLTDKVYVEIFSELMLWDKIPGKEPYYEMSRMVIGVISRFLNRYFVENKWVRTTNPDRWKECVVMPMDRFKEMYLENRRNNWKLRLLINEVKRKFDFQSRFDWPLNLSDDAAVVVIGYSSRGSGSQFKLPHFWVFSVSRQNLPQTINV